MADNLRVEPEDDARAEYLPTEEHQLHLNGPFCRAGSSVGHVYVGSEGGRKIEYTDGGEGMMA